ncbi:MAG: phage holin family protein [bacterium]|nr:MAG: phage holin family protein [bacterium]
MEILASLLLNSLAVYVTAKLLSGVTIDSFLTAIIVSIVLSLVNTFIKPLLVLFTLPVNILTLGLFMFVINALVILLVDSLVPGFSVSGFWWALLFSLILSLVGSVFTSFAK